jgi:integrase
VKSGLHKTGTIDTYQGHLDNHIMPLLVAPVWLLSGPPWFSSGSKSSKWSRALAPRTIETIYVILASIMRGAVRDDYVRKAPCTDIWLPEASETTIRLLTPGQVLALAGAMPPRYSLLVLLGAGTGLRQGEAFGLVLDRIDPMAEMVKADQQVIVADRRPILAPPKTSASLRQIPIPRFVAEAVTTHAAQLGWPTATYSA